jgi:hypothetical protein
LKFVKLVVKLEGRADNEEVELYRMSLYQGGFGLRFIVLEDFVVPISVS